MTAANALTKAVRGALTKNLPPGLSEKSGNLYEVLSRQPKDGVGSTVFQTRWTGKGIVGSHWEVTRARIKGEGDHGKAWGYLTWKGACSQSSFSLPLPQT